MGLKAPYILAQNIKSLLTARHQTAKSLAVWCRHSEPWIGKFLAGKREVQLRDLDRIADFFGLATYQLFQPGISPLTERRKGRDRRGGRDRRVSNAFREMKLADISLEEARARIDLERRETATAGSRRQPQQA